MSRGDRPVAVRPGAELPVERLAGYLGARLPGAAGASLEVLQFPSGFSNLTYLLRLGDRDLVLRRPPAGTRPRTGHDMAREHRVLSALAGRFPYAPRPLLYCDDESVVGAPFLVMERREGIILRRDPPPDLELPPATVRRLCERLVEVHAELHGLDYDALGLADLGRPLGYVERQVSGWARRYRRARTDDVPDFERVIRWLEERLPPERGASLVHNDFKLDNVVLDPADPTRIVGVLDWEMATLGDPLMDLGSSLGYWVEGGDPPDLQAIRMLPTNLEGAPTRAEVVALYARATGRDLPELGFYYVFGLFRLAAIAQQIYFRYARGEATDARFAALAHSVRVLESAAARAMAAPVL
ncbi:MAG: phosphotransferase family protein [Thermoanaerobaculia bacterium]|nr:phosphotransferase family protein [Thermoanaerobaculia bacterium]